MDDAVKFRLWQEMFEPALEKGELDSRYFYERALPCFNREKATSMALEAVPLGASRVGGSPDLPDGLLWPIHDSQAMTFLAQINLGELAGDFIPSLPQQGWLCFFISEEDTWLNLPHRILYLDCPSSELHRTFPPKDTQPPHRIYRPHTISFRFGFTLPGKLVWDMFFDRLEDHRDQSVIDVLFENFQEEATRVGGHSLAFQPEMELHPYLMINGYDLLAQYGERKEKIESFIQYKHLEKTDPLLVDFLRTEVYRQVEAYEQNIEYHHKRMKNLCTLLVLESMADMTWGDAGFLQFFIFQDDLEKCDFSRTCCDIIST